ncbi:aminoglycoside phosphotransferase family protein [Embleya sp. NPDC059237]|uniref:aminoglycoside phosphotransferase family protein n=1 Tax=Embleya sp. NPDC059237 TaxID=3346784 RepID=UPI00369BF833
MSAASSASAPPPSTTSGTPETPVPAERVVRCLVDAVLGRDAGRVVRPIDEGGEHSSWWVGADHVLRLARDADTSARQRREIALRDLLRPVVGVALPASVAAGEWADGLAYSLDTRIPGTSAELRRVSRRGEVALARMLAGLARVTEADAVGVGLPVVAPRSMAELREPAEAAAQRLSADGEFDGAPLRGPGAEPVSRVVVHGDLKGEHLMVGSGGRVRGVLDWTDAVVGDPAEDIAGLAIAVGAAAAVRVAAGAGYGPWSWARGLALARHDTLIRLADRLYGTDDSPIPLLRAQRDRAWQPTALDRIPEPPSPDAGRAADRWPWPAVAHRPRR